MEATFKETFLHSPLIGTFALKQKQTFEMIWTSSSSSFFIFIFYIIYTQIHETIRETRKTHFQIYLEINTNTKHCVYFKNAIKNNRNRHEDVGNAAVL